MRSDTSTVAVLLLWVGLAALAVPGNASAGAGDVERGKELFDLCTQCHGMDGGGNRDALAPAIAGMDAWYVEAQLTKFKAGLRGMHPGDTGGLRMYPMSRSLKSEQEIADLAAYIASLPAAKPAPELVGGDAAKGAALFAPCQQCHAANAAGVQAMGGAPLRFSSDWYLFDSLIKFKSGIRGAAPGDAMGAAMAGMARAFLPDEQAMKDVIAHIMTLREQP